MSSQARLENVLRDIHVMISKSEMYDTDRIIVSKQDIFNLIDRLNASIYEIMDEYELTQQSRDRALREKKKEGDKIIWDASRQAEDIYAASVLYTEEALNHLNVMVDEADATVDRMYKEFRRNIKQQQETIRENQLELKSQLQLLADTEKYLRLIEERNREIERERAEKKGRKTLETFGEKHAMIKPEIKINEEYFRKAGIPFEKEEEKTVDDEEFMQPLEDEGVIESTLKKAAEDIQQLFSEEIKPKNGEKQQVRQENPDKRQTGQAAARETEYAVKEQVQPEHAADYEAIQAAGSQSQAGQAAGSQPQAGQTAGGPVSSEYTAGSQSQTSQAAGGPVSSEYVAGNQSQTGQAAGGPVSSEYVAGSQLQTGQSAGNQVPSGQADGDEKGIYQAEPDGKEYLKMQSGELQQGSRKEPDTGNPGDEAEIKVNLDAEYFKQKNGEQDENTKAQHHEKRSLLDKLMGKKKTLL